ncbi:MAG: thiol-disulfide oxidoreductase DCC family protein [Sphingobacteriales bacterium]|nr:MAG: thiol-disulfide oxidoreductase DCC family protein [Sphingobacteriales bacterium]
MAAPVILFDGECNYCDAVVNFVIRVDRKRRLRFAALQSKAGQALLQQYGLSQEEFNSFVFIEDGKAWNRSTAMLRVLRYLPWWLQEARLGWLLPRPIRDAVYDWVARNRYRWFGKRDACMIPTPDVRARFLD